MSAKYPPCLTCHDYTIIQAVHAQDGDPAGVFAATSDACAVLVKFLRRDTTLLLHFEVDFGSILSK